MTTMNKFVKIISILLLVSCISAEEDSLRFNTSHHGDPGNSAPVVNPWKEITLDPEYGGNWVVTGDVDNDGQADIVSAQNANKKDVHYTSTAVAQRLDGSVIWRWGDPTIGRKKLHHDVACQIYDWDGDGKNEVILVTKGFLVELDGAAGKERRRIAIADEASDCLVFANLSGNNRATDVLVKTRYSQIWAYNAAGKFLWTVKNPGGSRTAHQVLPIDIDNDGKDEIMAGYALLNSDGSLRWKYHSQKVDQEKGHLDCCRILKKGHTPGEYRLVLTCCGANNIACVDGNGKVQWEVPGHHFESVQVGHIFPDLHKPQILVDIDHRPRGESPLWVFSADGKKLGQMMTDYCRQHGLLDWTGDGFMEIILADAHGVFNRSGERIVTFNTRGRCHSIRFGDMTGDGISDVTIVSIEPLKVCIFKNENGKIGAPLGCGVNYTFY